MIQDLNTQARREALEKIQISKAERPEKEMVQKVHDACRKHRFVIVRDGGTDPGANTKERMACELLRLWGVEERIQWSELKVYPLQAQSMGEALERAIDAFRHVLDRECSPDSPGHPHDPSLDWSEIESFQDTLVDFVGDLREKLEDPNTLDCERPPLGRFREPF